MKTSNSTNIATTTSWFRTAAPYIHAHRGARFVVAFDGETIATEGFDNLIHDFALLNSLGIKLILVYGARQQIDAQSKVHKVDIKHHHDLRITNNKSLKIVRSVIGKLRIDIEAKLSFGLPHTPMADAQVRCTSGNFVTARPVGIKDGIDFGHTGEVRRVDTQGINEQLALGNVVLLPPMGFSPTGELFNLSYEAIATAVATDLAADKLIFIGENCDELPREMTVEQTQKVDPSKSPHALNAGISACKSGVKRVHFLDRNEDGALLQELFSRDGAGTLITADLFETTRQATVEDVGGILELIQPLETQGVLVKRSRDHLEMEVDHFTVMERDGTVVACAALYSYPECQIGELACLAVSKDYQDQGRGEKLLSVIEQQAKSAGLSSLCVLTTQTAHWFLERGFKEAEIADLPVEKQSFYNYQRNAKVFSKNLA